MSLKTSTPSRKCISQLRVRRPTPSRGRATRTRAEDDAPAGRMTSPLLAATPGGAGAGTSATIGEAAPPIASGGSMAGGGCGAAASTNAPQSVSVAEDRPPRRPKEGVTLMVAPVAHGTSSSGSRRANQGVPGRCLASTVEPGEAEKKSPGGHQLLAAAWRPS